MYRWAAISSPFWLSNGAEKYVLCMFSLKVTGSDSAIRAITLQQKGQKFEALVNW